MVDVERARTFSGRRASQASGELAAFIELLRGAGVHRYLEIGARHGDTFHAVMSGLEPGALGVAVDLPGGAWGKSDTAKQLQRASRDLVGRGCGVHVYLGSSHEEALQDLVRRHAPYDAILIDGDHRYEAVSRDFADYGEMAPIVALHDIVGAGQHSGNGLPVEVPRLWGELRARYETVELVDDGSTMGIGIIYTRRPLQ